MHHSQSMLSLEGVRHNQLVKRAFYCTAITIREHADAAWPQKATPAAHQKQPASSGQFQEVVPQRSREVSKLVVADESKFAVWCSGFALSVEDVVWLLVSSANDIRPDVVDK